MRGRHRWGERESERANERERAISHLLIYSPDIYNSQSGARAQSSFPTWVARSQVLEPLPASRRVYFIMKLESGSESALIWDVGILSGVLAVHQTPVPEVFVSIWENMHRFCANAAFSKVLEYLDSGIWGSPGSSPCG